MVCPGAGGLDGREIYDDNGARSKCWPAGVYRPKGEIMGILSAWYFDDFDAPLPEHPERVALAAYNLGRDPFLLRVWPEYISWAIFPDSAAAVAGDDAEFDTEEETPGKRRTRLRQAQKQRMQRQAQLRDEGRDVLPPDLAELENSLIELSRAGAIEGVGVVELHLALDRLRNLFQAILRAYRATDQDELEWLLMREEQPWHDLVDMTKTAVQSNPDAQRWCKFGFWMGKCLACTSFPNPREITESDLKQLGKAAKELAPGGAAPWHKPVVKFLKVAKIGPHDDWQSQLRLAASALIAADAAIREALENAAGAVPWLIIDHFRGEIVLFGQSLPFTNFVSRGLKLFLVLASRPSQNVEERELLKLAGLKTKPYTLASYISRDVRPVLKPIVDQYGPLAGVEDHKAIGAAMVIAERKSYLSSRAAAGYRLAIPPQRVRHIHDPHLARQEGEATEGNGPR